MALDLYTNNEREFIYEACDRLCVLAGTERPVSSDPIWMVEKKGLQAVVAFSPSSGSVTSVGLAAPSMFSVSGSPVTGSGTLTLTLASQAPHAVLIGPTSGPNAQPTFRSLVASDLPSLPYLSSTLGSAHLFVGNAGNVATDVAASGDVTLANTGAFTVRGINGTLLSGLSTGLLKNTTATGIPSIAVPAVDYVAPSAYASANGLTMNTARLLGRTTALSGDAEEISVGSGLTLSAGTLMGTGGTVTAVSIATANGFAGSSSGGATPILTITTTITGMLKGDGTSISAAISGTDYLTPAQVLSRVFCNC
jgi:hypothetical protein